MRLFFAIAAIVLLFANNGHADCGRIVIVPVGPQSAPPVRRDGPPVNVITNDDVNVTVNIPVTKTDALPPITHPDSVRPPSLEDLDPVYYRDFYSENPYFKESLQQAVIAWNGSEQIMILQTNDEPIAGETAMLSILPLPGEPLEIKRAKNEHAVGDATNLITTTLVKQAEQAGMAASGVYGTIGISAKVGVHDFVAIRLGSLAAKEVRLELEKMLEQYLADRYGQNAVMPVVTRDLVNTVSRYRTGGYEWFILDLVVGKPLESPEGSDSENGPPGKIPVLYRFKSRAVYYPLVISGVGGTGETKVDLAIFSRTLLQIVNGPDNAHAVDIGGEVTAKLRAEQLASIDEMLPAFLGGNDQQIKGRIMTIMGHLEHFDDDFIMQAAN